MEAGQLREGGNHEQDDLHREGAPVEWTETEKVGQTFEQRIEEIRFPNCRRAGLGSQRAIIPRSPGTDNSRLALHSPISQDPAPWLKS